MAAPNSFPRHIYCGGVRSLELKGLVKAVYASGGDVGDAVLSSVGRAYLAENPKLTNPVNWGVVGTIAGVATAVMALVALLVACGSF